MLSKLLSRYLTLHERFVKAVQDHDLKLATYTAMNVTLAFIPLLKEIDRLDQESEGKQDALPGMNVVTNVERIP